MFLISDHEYQEPRASPSGWRKNRHMNIMNIGCWFSLIVLSLHCLTSPSSYITFICCANISFCSIKFSLYFALPALRLAVCLPPYCPDTLGLDWRVEVLSQPSKRFCWLGKCNSCYSNLPCENIYCTSLPTCSAFNLH